MKKKDPLGDLFPFVLLILIATILSIGVVIAITVRSDAQVLLALIATLTGVLALLVRKPPKGGS